MGDDKGFVTANLPEHDNYNKKGGGKEKNRGRRRGKMVHDRGIK